MAVASRCIDGGIVVKGLLVAALWLAGWGAARLAATVLPESGMGGQLVVTTLAVWNPYVSTPAAGTLSLLLGYGCLPWVATTMLALRSTENASRTGFFGLAFWIALAGLTPTGLLLAATVAVVCVGAPGTGRPRWLCAAAASGISVLAALPWLTSALLGLSSADRIWAHVPDVAAFAARAEPGLGTLGSLASLGGIWNSDAVLDSRATLFAVISAFVLLVLVAVGIASLVRCRVALPLLVLAGVSVVLTAAMATGPGMAVLHAAVTAAPGLGVLRDGQKWVALAMPGYALAGAGAVLTLRRWLRPAVAAAVCCAALVLSLPDLAWGATGKVESVHYPTDWSTVATAINRGPAEVAVLPADTMRRFAWSGPAPVLDPLPRWLHADVLSTGDLAIAGTTVLGEGNHARAVQRLLLAGAEPQTLRDAGVGWLVVELGTPGDMGSAATTLERLPVSYRGRDLALYRVGGATAGASADQRRTAVIAHLAWLVLLVGGAAGLAWRQRAGAHSGERPR